MEGHWLILTDGWAIFAIGCIIYFIINIICEIGLLIEKKNKKKKNNED